MRLIDADALLKVMQESKESSQRGLDKDAKWAYATHDYFMQKINEQPTVNESVKGDLISRAELINTIYGKDYFTDTIKEVLEDIINNQPTVSNDGWIPCSERLPEESACYLVAWMDERNRTIPFYEIVEFGDGDWCEDIPQAKGNYRILAWQPLPQAYREENENV